MRAPNLLLVLALGLSSLPAFAHDADIVFVQANPQEDGTVQELATLTGATLALLAPVDVDGDGVLSEAELPHIREPVEAGFWESVPLSAGDRPCVRQDSGIRLREGYVELSATFRCPSGEDLRQRFKILSLLPAGYRVVLGTQQQGEVGQRFAEGQHQTLHLAAEAAGGESEGPQGFLGWVLLGAEHIFTGYDHLAFLAALLLVASSWRRLLWMVTAFTLAHSITLGVTAVGWVSLSASRVWLVELAIAASVVFVAVENLLGVRERYRPLLTFCFGLIHGFGFASVLAQLGLGGRPVVALAGFNLGVELGQAAVVAALFPLLRLLARRERWRAWGVGTASALIAAVGCFWLVTRLLG